MPLEAEQPDTAAEVCGLTEGYPFGNNSHLLKGDEWTPQVAALR